MNRLIVLLSLVIGIVVACSDPEPRDETSPRKDGGVTRDAGSSGEDAGNDGEDAGTSNGDAGFVADGGTSPECHVQPMPTDGGVVRYVRIEGFAELHSAEVQWRAQQSDPSLKTPPSLSSATLHIEDAIKAQSGLPPLRSTTLGDVSGGEYPFSVDDVDVKFTTLALMGTVESGDADPTGLILKSTTLIGKPPFASAFCAPPVQVVTRPFLAALAAAIGTDVNDVLDGGVIVGRAVDKNGQPAAGVKLVRLYGSGASARIEEVTEGIFYLNDDLSAVRPERSTGASGLFVRIGKVSAAAHTLIETDATSYLQEGKKEFPGVLIGSRTGAATVVTFNEVP